MSLPALVEAELLHVDIPEGGKGIGAGQTNSFQASDVELAHLTSVTCHCQNSVTWLPLAARGAETWGVVRARMYPARLYSYGRRRGWIWGVN